MTETLLSIEAVQPHSAVGWAVAEMRRGVYELLVGGGRLLATGIGGAVRVFGEVVGGAMEGAAQGMQNVLNPAAKQGPQPEA